MKTTTLFHMGRCFLFLVLISASAFGQNQAPGMPKLNPNRARALENALRQPDFLATKPGSISKGFTLPPLSTGMLQALPSGPRVLGPEALSSNMRACAIPLLRVPVDSHMDPKIRHELNNNGRSPDNMPAVTGLPPCPDDPAAR